ncbi:MAG: alkaline phosphatase family protein [Chloroflexi bacterium]|nr:alkaline phosphatase family protein [Chloroflexota bacterium]
MTDLTDSLLPRLTSRALPGLTLWPQAVPPHYGGYSIANLPSSLAAWLRTPAFGMGPLAPELTAPLGPDVRRVVVLLLDAMGLLRFRDQLRAPGSVWARLGAAGLFGALTSVFPSTTVAALTSLWTGRAPGEHGLLAYEMWLREYGMVANMIDFSPITLDSQPHLLFEAGLDPTKFLTLPTLGAHLAASGRPIHTFLHYQLLGSGLSRMHLAGAEAHGFFSSADLAVNLRELLEATAGQPQLVWVYWPTVDTLSHYYGPAGERVEHEVNAFGRTLAEACLDQLSPAARAGTVLIVLADHGQVATPDLQSYDLRQRPEFTDLLHILPTGEHRAAFLHCRPGRVDAARSYIERAWPGRFTVEDQPAVMASGLLGRKLDPRTPARLGELLVLSRGAAHLWWAAKEDHLLGRHGGLSAEEMLVPYLAARLA